MVADRRSHDSESPSDRDTAAEPRRADSESPSDGGHVESSDVERSIDATRPRVTKQWPRGIRFYEWLVLDGNRLVIAAGISLSMFVALLAGDRLGVISFANDDSITRLAGGMIAGSFSLVTLVVTLNQLVLSREFASADEVSDRLDGIMTFRKELEAAAEIPVSPGSPSRILELIAETIADRAEQLGETVAETEDEAFAVCVADYVDGITTDATELDETLEGTEFGTFTAVSSTVAYDHAWQLYAARQLRERAGDDLSSEADQAFAALQTALRLFTEAQEHFKTIYLKRELTRLSQLTIVTGVPSIVAAMVLGLTYAGPTGAVLPETLLPVVGSGLIAVVSVPLALLAAYIIRTATITRRTASVGPMLPGKDPDADPFAITNEAAGRGDGASEPVATGADEE